MYKELIEEYLKNLNSKFYETKKAAEWYDIVEKENERSSFSSEDGNTRIVKTADGLFIKYVYDYFYEGWNPSELLEFKTYKQVYVKYPIMILSPPENEFKKLLDSV